MSFTIVGLDLDTGPQAVELDAPVEGIAIVSRRDGRVVGFAIHATGTRRRFDADEIAALADPAPLTEPALRRAHGPVPRLTLAICTHDRAELLDTCLGSLGRQTEPPDEILVVDNAPSDARSAAVVDAHRSRLGDRLRRVVEPCPGLDVARNLALREARGEVVAFVDDDVVVDPHFCESQRSIWQGSPDAGAVTGQILPHELDTDAQVAFELRGGFRGARHPLRWSGTDDPDNPIYPYSPGMFGAGANLAVRREVALRLGGFDEALDTGAPLPGGGDMDLCHRVLRAGLDLVYEPRIVVFHRHRRDHAALRRQYDSWGRSLTAWATKVYRIDPAGRRKLRLLARWFVSTQVRELGRATARRDRGAAQAATAELRGAAGGLLGTYGRSRRRTGRLRRRHGRPRVAILPWGDVIDDYLEPIALSLDDLVERLDGGWLFGYIEALRRADVESVIICWTAHVEHPSRRIHLPSGTPLWLLPQPGIHRRLRARVDDPYSWSAAEAVGRRRGSSAVAARVARQLLPHTATNPMTLARVLQQEGIRSILCQEYEEGRFDVCALLARTRGLRVSATFQGGNHTRTRVERLVRARSVRLATALIIGDDREIQRVTTAHGITPDRIVALPNPFDPRSLPPVARAVARHRLGVDAGCRLVVWHGRVDVHPKGIDILLDAWEQILQRSAGGVRLSLLGTGSGASWLRSEIDRRGLHSISWRDEYVLDREVISQHLAAGDVYVLPSRQEGFPVAPVEAMAAGLPVVAADAPGVRGVVGVGPEAGGLVVPRGDASALAHAVLALLDDPERRASLAIAARRRVDSHFSLNAVGGALRTTLVGDR